MNRDLMVSNNCVSVNYYAGLTACRKVISPKGMIINGTEGVGKTIAVDTFLSVIKDV